MTVNKRILLVIFGLILGGVLGVGLFLKFGVERCTPNTFVIHMMANVKAWREPCYAFDWNPRDPAYDRHVIRYNNFGLNDEITTLEKPDDVFRILILGDSYPQGLQLPREQGFPDLLETALNKQSGRKVEVINFGVDTLGTDRLLMLYALVGYRFEADVVLLSTYVGNDVQNNNISLEALRNEGYQPYPFFRLDEAGNLVLYNYTDDIPDDDAPALTWLRRVITRQPGIITTPESPAVISTDPYTLAYPVQLGVYLPEDEDWAEAWALTGAILAQFKELTAAQGSDFGLLIIPDRRSVHRLDYERTISDYAFVGAFDAQAPVARMVAIAEKHDIPALNMLPLLLDVAQRGERAYLEIDGHYNAVGHGVTADALVLWLMALGWV